MKKLVFSILLSCISLSSFSQSGMYGFGVGLGYTTSYHSDVTAAVEGYHLWRISSHLYAGGVLSLQRYSFLYDYPKAPSTYGDMISIRQKSTFLFFSPKLDFGIGYRKYIHLNVSGGLGVVMSAGQKTNELLPLLTTPGGGIGSDTIAVNTSYNVPRIISRVGFGITERIPTHRYFNIVLSQELSLIPSDLNRNGPALQTNYLSFTVGLMHKYPQKWRAEDN